MSFPEHMTLQYFFFDTYIGYFLQVLPIALSAGAGFFFYRRQCIPEISSGRLVCSSLFVCYLAGLLSLTLLREYIGALFFALIHHTPPEWEYRFSFDYQLVPALRGSLGKEQLGNILLFLPFGILHPLSQRNSTWKSTLLWGILTSFAIESMQPFIGRSFDINDLLLNSAGVLTGALTVHAGRMFLKNRSPS